MMARLLFRVLARWPGVPLVIAAAIAITCLVLICSWVWIWRGFPPAPAGESLYYAKEGLNRVWDHVRYILSLSPTRPTDIPVLMPAIVSIWITSGLVITIRALGARLAFSLVRSYTHDQIIGQGQLPSRLVRELRRDGELTVQYQRVPTPFFADGVLHLPLSKRPQLRNGCIALVVDDDDVFNLRALEDLHPGESAMIRIEHPDLRLNAARKDSVAAGVHRYFSAHELGARLASRRHPLIASAGIDGCCEIVCGAGQIAQAVASQAIRSHHYGFRSAPSIVLLGPESEFLLGRLNSAFPALREWAGPKARVISYSDRAGLLEALSSLRGALRIHICEESGEDMLLLLQTLIDLTDDLAGHIERVFVHAAAFHPDLLQVVRSRCHSRQEYVLLDLDWNMQSGDFLTQARLDQMAITMHEAYLEQAAQSAAFGNKASHVQWDALPESFRDENRNLADHLFLKLAESGIVAHGEQEASVTVLAPVDWSRLADDNLDALAQAEHARWAASRILRGWVYDSDRDDERLRHPDLVPWDALSDGVRAYDRKMIQALPEVFARTGLQLYSARPAAEAILHAIRKGRPNALEAERWVRLRMPGHTDITLQDTGWELFVENEDEAVTLLEELLDDWPELSNA